MRRKLLLLIQRNGPRVRNWIAKSLVLPRRIAFVDRALGSTADFGLDCRTVRAHLSDWNDGHLSKVQSTLVRAHVATCAMCGPVHDSLQNTLTLLHDLRDEPSTLDPRR